MVQTTKFASDAKQQIHPLANESDVNKCVKENEVSDSLRQPFDESPLNNKGGKPRPKASRKEMFSKTVVQEEESRLELEKLDHKWQHHGVSGVVASDQLA